MKHFIWLAILFSSYAQAVALSPEELQSVAGTYSGVRIPDYLYYNYNALTSTPPVYQFKLIVTADALTVEGLGALCPPDKLEKSDEKLDSGVKLVLLCHTDADDAFMGEERLVFLKDGGFNSLFANTLLSGKKI